VNGAAVARFGIICAEGTSLMSLAQQIHSEMLVQSCNNGTEMFPATILFTREDFQVLGMLHHVTSKMFVIHLQFGVHEKSCLHLGEVKDASLNVSHLFPKFGSESKGVWDVTHNGVKFGNISSLDARFVMAKGKS
jgi:hypothetical protein